MLSHFQVEHVCSVVGEPVVVEAWRVGQGGLLGEESGRIYFNFLFISTSSLFALLCLLVDFETYVC
ncbi:ATP-dependent endonuclease, partial [Erwinia amylovora]|nr:ATP-dependent endonuclease [Erwinia amylovora]